MSDSDKAKTGPRVTGAAPAGKGEVASTDARGTPSARASDADVADFVRRIKELAPATTVGRGRLIFAMDATMSRQPTWDMALALQAEMFKAVKAVGGLDVQLIYYRGLAECRASRWVSDARALGGLMEKIDCRGGHTQIGKVLAHARRESEK